MHCYFCNSAQFGNCSVSAIQFSTATCSGRDPGSMLPAELSIVGFDDAPISRYVYPKLTTVHYPIADMARMASRWVLKHVYDQQDLDVQQVFEPRLIERDSVSRPA
jgi:LacI family transcriptional regulator